MRRAVKLSSPAAAVPLSAAATGGGALVLVALPSGVALIATKSRCNSNPDGDTTNPEWTFSAYCKALAFHPYQDPVSFAGGLLPCIFALPLLVVLGSTLLGGRSGTGRRDPVRLGLGLGAALAACLVVLAFGFARATFHGV